MAAVARNACRGVLPEYVADDLKVLMPVFWCLNDHHSRYRLVCPIPVLHLIVLLVRESVGMARCVVSNESNILEAIACSTNRVLLLVHNFLARAASLMQLVE